MKRVGICPLCGDRKQRLDDVCCTCWSIHGFSWEKRFRDDKDRLDSEKIDEYVNMLLRVKKLKAL